MNFEHRCRKFWRYFFAHNNFLKNLRLPFAAYDKNDFLTFHLCLYANGNAILWNLKTGQFFVYLFYISVEPYQPRNGIK